MKYLALMSLILLSNSLDARPITVRPGRQDLKKDFREMCRGSLSGVYMEYLNDISLAEENLILVNRNLEKLAAEITAKTAELTKLEAVLKSTEYNAKGEDQKVAVDHRLAQLKASQEEKLNEKKSLTASIASLTLDRDAYVKKLEKVFEVKYVKDDSDFGYTVGLEYRFPCGQFQILCPLPDDQRASLVAILPKDRLPEHCLSYSKLVIKK